MQDAPKAVWSIPYISVAALFPSLKHNFIAYRSSKVSSRPDCIFEIHQQSQSGFSRVYSNCCCSCSFEPEIIKIGRSSHKMYSNNILNFQESTTILNARTKESGKVPRTVQTVSKAVNSKKTECPGYDTKLFLMLRLHISRSRRSGVPCHFPSFSFCSRSHQIQINYFNRSFWPIDESLIGTTTVGQSRSGSNGNNEVFTFSRSPEMKPHHQMQFRVIHRIPIFFWGGGTVNW